MFPTEIPLSLGQASIFLHHLMVAHPPIPAIFFNCTQFASHHNIMIDWYPQNWLISAQIADLWIKCPKYFQLGWISQTRLSGKSFPEWERSWWRNQCVALHQGVYLLKITITQLGAFSLLFSPSSPWAGYTLSLIQISEPTRPERIEECVFCF